MKINRYFGGMTKLQANWLNHLFKKGSANFRRINDTPSAVLYGGGAVLFGFRSAHIAVVRALRAGELFAEVIAIHGQNAFFESDCKLSLAFWAGPCIMLCDPDIKNQGACDYDSQSQDKEH